MRIFSIKFQFNKYFSQIYFQFTIYCRKNKQNQTIIHIFSTKIPKRTAKCSVNKHKINLENMTLNVKIADSEKSFEDAIPQLNLKQPRISNFSITFLFPDNYNIISYGLLSLNFKILFFFKAVVQVEGLYFTTS